MDPAPPRPRRDTLRAKILLALGAGGLTLLSLVLVWHDEARFLVWTLTHDERPLGIHRHDPRYCYVHIPGSSVVHEASEFSVTYTIDGRGHRITPTPANAAGRATLLGCSYTFGHGVEDRETYAHLLGQRHWKTLKVRNRAVMGWGVQHALLALEDEMKEPTPPRLVLYGWMRDHVDRVGTPQYCGNTHSAFMEDPQKANALTPAQELGECVAAVQRMYDLCRDRGVPFFAVMLSSPNVYPDQDEDLEYGRMMDALKISGIPTIDLTQIGRGMFYPIDHHPRPGWHQAVAAALASKVTGL